MSGYYYGQNILCPTAPCNCHKNEAEQWVSDSCCVGTYTTSGCCGHGSVLLSSGMFAFQRELISAGAVGDVSWGFSLDYLAGNGVDGILGKGFNFPQNLRLELLPGGSVQMASGQNTLELFVPAGPGRYTAPATNNTRGELSSSGDTFTLTASNGTVTKFWGFGSSTPGRLKSITDRYGNLQSYVWQRVGAVDQLVSVTDSYGRTVQYGYYGPDVGYRLRQITDFLGRQLNFQYDGSGRLVAVVTPSILQAAVGNTFPGGTAYVFQYDVNNPRPERQDDLVKIWFPNEATPFIDAATRTVDVAGVYQSATPRYAVQYGQDPTDAEMWGRVVAETIGDPANGVGGTYQYLYTTEGLPGNMVDPGEPIVFRCVVTDRHGNQTVYDFNAAQMPVRVEVNRTRAKIDIPAFADFPSYVTWTKYNTHNQPLLQVLPAGNSVEYQYEDGNVPGLGFYNRRAGLLLRRTAKPGNTLGISSRAGSSGQTQLTERLFYEPIFNQRCARIERRGNPINGSGGYFTPQNEGTGPSDADRSRYAAITYYDYQKDADGTITGDLNLQAQLALSGTQIQALLDFVNGQMSATGGTGGIPAGFQRNLGDINGDGTGSGTVKAAPHLGNVVKIEHPSVRQIGASAIGAQTRVEVFTSNARGQTTTHTDPNGNLTVYVRYPYNDPEGNGGALGSVPADVGGKQYGRLKEVHGDAGPNDVLSLVGGDGDLVDFIPAHTGISRANTPNVYLDLVTRYEGGSGAGGSGCASCAYDAMGNPLAVTDPRGFTTRYDRNELGEAYRTISPQPYNFRVEMYFDANRNTVRVDTEDLQPAFDSSDPSSAAYAQFSPTGSGSTAHVPMQPGPGGSVRPGWFTNLFRFNLLDDKIEEDLDATGSTPANLVTTFLYDPNQNLIQVTKPAGNIVEYDYDERNLRIATRVGRDAASGEPGAVTITAFDANGNLLQVIGPADRGGTTATATIADAFRSGTTLSYTGDLVVSNTYDGFDRVIKATDALGNFVDTGAGYTSDPFLDPDGRVIRSDDYGPVDGGSTTNVRLAQSFQRFDEAGRQYEVQRNVFVADGTTLPSSGRTVTHFNGGLETNIPGSGHTGSLQIYPIPTSAPFSTYVLTRMIYDAGGRTVATLADNTAATNFVYDGADRQIQVTDALLNVVDKQFDATGNLVLSTRTEKCTITAPTVASETFATAMFYDSLNQLVLQAEQGADGTFDANLVGCCNAPFWQLAAATLVTCLGYDSRGNRVLSVDPKGNSSLTVYDGASRAIQTQQHLRQAGQGENPPASKNPPASNETFLPGGRASIVTTMILDGNGRHTQLIDDRGDITRFEYDTLDREVKMIFHDDSTRTSGYDAAGDVTTFTDENGSLFENTFDALGRKIAVAITPATGVIGTTAQSFQYDGLSRQTFAEDTDGSNPADVTLVYDSLGRLVEESQGNTRYVTNTAFTSLPATQFTFPGPVSSPRQITNSYDLLDRRTQVQETSGGANIASWQFFGPERPAEVALGNGLICTWMNNARNRSAVQASGPANPSWGDRSSDRLGYDGCGRAITKRYLAGGISGGSTHPYNDAMAVVGFTTELDRAGNKFFERHLHAPDRSHLYEPFDANQVPQGGYDSLDRLRQYQRGTLASGGGSITTPISLPNTDLARSYDLDGLGNWRRTVFTPAGSSTPQTEVRQHNGLNQITRTQNGSTQINPTYDKNGNLLSDGTLTYKWDALNRLVQVTRASDQVTIVNYFYDALDRRVRKYIPTGGGLINDCLYSGWRCVEERNGSNDSGVQYVWGMYLDELLQQKLIVGVNGFSNGTLLYPLQDLLYRTTGLADSSGVIREAYDTDAYGRTLIFRNGTPPGSINFSNSDTQVSVPTCPFLFTGQRFDPETGLYYYKRRYYSPELGRFVSRDPIGYTGGMDLYEYAGDSPVTRTDPTGLDFWTWFGRHFGILYDLPNRDDATCCKDAKRAGEDKGSLGGVICCDGRNVKCVWMENRYKGDPTADGFVQECALAHEQCHLNLMDIPDPTCTCGETKRQGWRKGVDSKSSECVCYLGEIECLMGKKSKCGANQTCKDQIQNRIDFAKKERVDLKCNLPNPK